MATAINVSVDETLKKEATDLYADLGLTVQEAIRIFLRRSVRMRGMPFPMNKSVKWIWLTLKFVTI